MKSQKKEKQDLQEKEYVYNSATQGYDLVSSVDLKKSREKGSTNKEQTPNDIFLNMLDSGKF